MSTVVASIRELTANADDASIVRATISLAHDLHISVVAEGVESAAQLELLRKMECDQYQGFHHSPAVPAGEVERLVRRSFVTADMPTEPPMSRTLSKLARLRTGL